MSTQPSIPFLDLVKPHRELEEELLSVVRRALESAAFVGGPAVEEFETLFAPFCEANYCVGVNSGTDALRFALISCGLGEGDAVVTVPNTFIATTEAISQAGAVPEFVDIDERTYNMDPARLSEYLDEQCVLDQKTGDLVSRRSGKRVRAIVPVHLYGQMADMDPILELAGQYGLTVIEDACQAHGAEYFSRKHNRWFKAGSMGRAAAFSFYPGKNLGACGEAGAVTTNDESVARTCRMLRDHGQAQKYYHELEGYNGRLDAIQAGMLRVKLSHLAGWNQQRREVAARYDALLANHSGIVTPHVPTTSKPVYHLYVVRVANREDLQAQLASQKIGTGIHYPIPLHLQKAYAKLGLRVGNLPVAERVASQVLSLPMFPQLTAEQQARVVEAVRAYGSAKLRDSLPVTCNAV
jgi:dTDP-4-amino-4,6-dideoxygalactose transaminase